MIQEKEISLSSAFRVIWERGKRILTFTIIAVIIGAIASLFIHNRYQAYTRLVVQVSSIGEHNVAKNWHPYNVYWNLFPTPESLNMLIDKYDLDKPPYNFKTFRDLQKRVAVYSVESSPLFTIDVRLESATAAANVANDLALEAVLMSKNLQEDEIKRSLERLETQLMTINDEMDSYQERYKNILVENNTETKINYLDTLNTIIATKRQELATIEPGIVEIEAKIASFKEILSSTDFNQVVALKQTLEQNPLLLEYLRTDEVDDFSQIENLTLHSEEINNAYTTLLTTYQDLRAQLPAQKVLRDVIKEDIKQLEVDIALLSDEIAINQIEEQIAKQDFDRAIEILGGIDKQVGWVGTTVTTERLDVYQVSKAIPHDKKVYPQRSLIVGVIGMIAFLVSFIYYLLLDIYGLVQVGIRKEHKETPTS